MRIFEITNVGRKIIKKMNHMYAAYILDKSILAEFEVFITSYLTSSDNDIRTEAQKFDKYIITMTIDMVMGKYNQNDVADDPPEWMDRF